VTDAARPLRVFLVAGEKSGDELGGRLMAALRKATNGGVEFAGVGGEAMQGQGLESLFPMADIAVMGILPVIKRLPTVLARIRATANAVLTARPDALVIIDSPDFTHRVAKRVRARAPDIPIIDYVSPTVWAWRPGRARKMRAYVDELMALLPFEPEAHRRLGGPACTYVGHPLMERLAELRPSAEDGIARESDAPTILLLPGSRRAEIDHLLADFGAAAERVAREFPRAEFILPAVPHLESRIRELVSRWTVKPRIVLGEGEKYAAFRRARAALAASGTVTLELALARVPAVVAYRVSRVEEWLAYRLLTLQTIVLPNLVLGKSVYPEVLNRQCTPRNLADALLPILRPGAEREAQLAKLGAFDEHMRPPGNQSPSDCAAMCVLETMRRKNA
jgi:lipid-A-disaccharide synthase